MAESAATYWNTSVQVDGITKVLSAGSSASDAIERAIPDCVYYQTIYPGQKVAITGIQEVCSACHNEGTVAKRTARSYRKVRCPLCKGKVPQGRMADIAFRMPDSANKISLAQAV